MAQAANPFFGTYKTPHQTVPFDKIKLSHYEPAFKKAIEENQKEIDAIVNQRSMPTFENTIEALDRSGQMLNRVASAFFALLSAESNDEMMEISQRVQPMLSKNFSPASSSFMTVVTSSISRPSKKHSSKRPTSLSL